MRKKLAIHNGERATFRGVFERFGTKNGYKGPIKTILLCNIDDEKRERITDHLWFNLTKGFENLNLVKGDRIQFTATVKPYVKGNLKRYKQNPNLPLKVDYKLSNPRAVVKIEQE